MNSGTDSSGSGFSNYVQVPKMDRLRINSELGLNHPNRELNKYSLTPLNSGFEDSIQEDIMDALTENRKSGIYRNNQDMEDDTNISSTAKSDFCCSHLIPELNSYNLTVNSGFVPNHYIEERNYSHSFKASTGLVLHRHPLMTTISDGKSKPAPPSVQHHGFLVNESSLSSSTNIQGNSKMSELAQTSPHHFQNDHNPQELPILEEEELLSSRSGMDKKGKDALTLHFERISLSTQDFLPDNFVMPKMDHYDGIGCPRNHLLVYLTYMERKGLNDAQIAHLFPRTLSGPALLWFLSLNSRVKSWRDVITVVLKKYGMGINDEDFLILLSTEPVRSNRLLNMSMMKWSTPDYSVTMAIRAQSESSSATSRET